MTKSNLAYTACVFGAGVNFGMAILNTAHGESGAVFINLIGCALLIPMAKWNLARMGKETQKETEKC